jgi:hypothetical protein
MEQADAEHEVRVSLEWPVDDLRHQGDGSDAPLRPRPAPSGGAGPLPGAVGNVTHGDSLQATLAAVAFRLEQLSVASDRLYALLSERLKDVEEHQRRTDRDRAEVDGRVEKLLAELKAEVSAIRRRLALRARPPAIADEQVEAITAAITTALASPPPSGSATPPAKPGPARRRK